MTAYEIKSDLGFAVLEGKTEQEALETAREYAKRWQAEVKLYKTPELNFPCRVSACERWPGQIELIRTICGVPNGNPAGPQRRCQTILEDLG